MSDRLIKIVRDRVGQEGDQLVYGQASDAQVIEGLRKKLIEEAAEYVLDPSVDELADVLEVVNALARHDLKLTFEDVLSAAHDKYHRRGGFNAGVGMFARRVA